MLIDNELANEQLKSFLKNFQADIWYRTDDERRYFTNIYDIEGLDNKVSSRLMLTLFYYGYAVITKFQGKYLVCIPAGEPSSFDLDGTWLGGKVSLSPTTLKGIQAKQTFKPFKVSKENSVFFKWNDLAIPPALIISEVIQKIILLETNAITNTITSAKTHEQSVISNNSFEQLKDQIKWLDPSTNLINRISQFNGIEGSNGAIENQMLSLKPIENQNPTNVFFENYIAYTKIAYQRLGKRGQTIDKKERVITSEQENSESTYPILERETIRNLREGIIDMNNKFNLDLKLFVFVPSGEIQDSSTDDISTGDPTNEERLGGE